MPLIIPLLFLLPTEQSCLVKKQTYKFLFLGIAITIIASGCYSLISPKNTTPYLANDTLNAPVVLTQEPPPINSPVISSIETEAPLPQLITISHVIENGDSLSSIFSSLDLSRVDLHKIIHTNTLGKQFANIKPGKELSAFIDTEGKLQRLTYNKNAIESLIATRSDNTFDVQVDSKQTETKITSALTTISSSLFLDGKESGLSDRIIMELASIFAWDIDFALSLRKDDQFIIIYEKTFVEGKEIGSGNILSAEFINQGHAYTAVRFEDKNGSANYFTPDGKSMRKAFLRTPVDFARISSHFNLRRKHPVLNRIRAHKGVDYAARTGTKIKTTGDGKIIFRGRKGGYGRVVIVQHGQKYSSLYAHMSNFKRGQKVGSHVKQGEIIGYVGKSGLATGSHLHYEFRVNGVHRNPLTVRLPHSQPIKKSLLAEFKKQTQPLLSKLNKVKASTLFAQNIQP